MRSYRTGSPLPVPDFATLAGGGIESSAVCFLWHCSSPHGVRSLTGILLCGARTFLYAHKTRSDCLASFVAEFNTMRERPMPASVGLVGLEMTKLLGHHEPRQLAVEMLEWKITCTRM